MNQIAATVTDISETEVVTFISVESGGTSLRLIKSKAPEWLSVGDEIYCTFQEASVCVGKDCSGSVSIENRLSGVLTDVRNGGSLCELTFESSVGQVIALITSRAYDELGLEAGCEATMLLRGVDINVMPQLAPIDLDQYRKIVHRTKSASK